MDASRSRYTPVYDSKTTENLQKEFNRLNDEYYLDHAGATLYSETQIKKSANDLCSTLYGNPHSLGSAGKLTLDIVDQMRYRILEHFQASNDEYSVIFTSGATAALKLVAETFCFNEKGNYTMEDSGNFVYVQDNHTSVLGMREVVAQKGAKVICLGHDESFQIFQTLEPQFKPHSIPEASSNSLFVYSAQSGFSGLKYPLTWIEKVKNAALCDVINNNTTKWYTLLDAASFAATNVLNLSKYKPDFVCLSFYKMFGYPTGIGALLVRNRSASVLKKVYYGGGTVEITLSSEMFHVKKPVLHDRFEDGTISFLSILSLGHGFDALSKISTEKISQHVFSLAKYLYRSLLTLHHSNGKPMVILYSDTDYEDPTMQGGIVAFNLLRSNGENIGYVEVLNMANLYGIHLRTGCFCNPGACQRHLNLSNERLKKHYNAGHVCGDERDLIDGKPTGAVRISFGYMSTIKEVYKLLEMIKKCFLDGPEVSKVPDWWAKYKTELRKKYYSDTLTLPDDNKENIINISVQRESLENSVDGNGKKEKLTLNVRDGRKVMKLKHLFVYPIKSCAAYAVTGPWILGPKGLEYDREWMIVTSAGVCLTQKLEIKLCLVRPFLRLQENLLELKYPGMPSITVPFDNCSNNSLIGTLCQSKVCGHRVQGIDCGADVSEWLSLALGRPGLRLLRQHNQKKNSGAKKKPEISFASQAQYLLINEGSIHWIANKIPENSECDKNTILHRFRGNIVVEGCEAFQEMAWNHVQIGKNDFKVESPCTRCQMVCIDQITGEKTVEPLRTLAEEFHGKLRFGIYLTKESNGNSIIKIGDKVNYA